jgi:hypothetical protein
VLVPRLHAKKLNSKQAAVGAVNSKLSSSQKSHNISSSSSSSRGSGRAGHTQRGPGAGTPREGVLGKGVTSSVSLPALPALPSSRFPSWDRQSQQLTERGGAQPQGSGGESLGAKRSGVNGSLPPGGSVRSARSASGSTSGKRPPRKLVLKLKEGELSSLVDIDGDGHIDSQVRVCEVWRVRVNGHIDSQVSVTTSSRLRVKLTTSKCMKLHTPTRALASHALSLSLSALDPTDLSNGSIPPPPPPPRPQEYKLRGQMQDMEDIVAEDCNGDGRIGAD